MGTLQIFIGIVSKSKTIGFENSIYRRNIRMLNIYLIKRLKEMVANM